MPLFTVGVTTYNRPALLKRCLDSLVHQTAGDFEVLVGNDYQAGPLSGDLLGVADPRVRFINHPRNLGERGNLNALLAEARGRYFTWQFDDDLYATDFVERVRDALDRAAWPLAAFTSYEKVFDESAPPLRPRGRPGDAVVLPGADFLERYLGGRIRAMGLTGVFETTYLRAGGGAPALTDGRFALYAEYLLLVRAALLDRVAYVNAPLVYYYVHEGSWGNVNEELTLYRQAGVRLLTECAAVLATVPERDTRRWVQSLVRMVVADYAKHACARPGLAGLGDAADFARQLHAQFLPNGRAGTAGGGPRFVVPFLKAKLKRLLPASTRVALQRIHARFQ